MPRKTTSVSAHTTGDKDVIGLRCEASCPTCSATCTLFDGGVGPHPGYRHTCANGHLWACTHDAMRNLYDQRPPSEGRKLQPVRRYCRSCGYVTERS